MSLSNKNGNLSCWIITEGMVGTENQCLGVTDSLKITPKVIKIGLKQPWKTLTPWLGFEYAGIFNTELNPPWPDLVITSGRKAIAASRYIKKKSKGKSYTVHIQDPKCNPKDFDLVAAPFHDRLRGKNVLVTDGAPNRITEEKLEQAKTEFGPFINLPEPRIAVLIGGNSRTHKMTSDITKELVRRLKTLNGGLMITTSRRTGEENTQILKEGLGSENIYFWDGQAPNPYHGMLAWADFVLVTEDSVSMISDACTTGKPVYTIKLEGQSKRFDKFHNHLCDIGATKAFEGNLEHFTYEPLQDAKKIAHAIKSGLGEKEA
jgi:hypothetical protein